VLENYRTGYPVRYQGAFSGAYEPVGLDGDFSVGIDLTKVGTDSTVTLPRPAPDPFRCSWAGLPSVSEPLRLYTDPPQPAAAPSHRYPHLYDAGARGTPQRVAQAAEFC
jgi:hypothetical protein